MSDLNPDSNATETKDNEVKTRVRSSRIKRIKKKKDAHFDMGYERTIEPTNYEICRYCSIELTKPCKYFCESLKAIRNWKKFVKTRGVKSRDYPEYTEKRATHLLTLPRIEKKSPNAKNVNKPTNRTTTMRKVKKKKAPPTGKTKKENSDKKKDESVVFDVRRRDRKLSFRYHRTQASLQQTLDEPSGRGVKWGGADFKFPAADNISQTVLYNDRNHPMTSMALVPHSDGDIAYAVQNDTKFYVLQSKRNYNVEEKIGYTFESKKARNTEICLSPTGDNAVLRYRYADEALDTGECVHIVLYNLTEGQVKGKISLDRIEDKPSKMAFSADGKHFMFLYQQLPMGDSTAKTKTTKISYRRVENFEQYTKILRVTTSDVNTMGIQDIAFYQNTADVLIINNNRDSDSPSQLYVWKLGGDRRARLKPDLNFKGQALSIASFQDKIVVGYSEGGFCVVGPSKQACQLLGHTWNVNSFAFSADGKYLVSGSDDATVRLWNLNEIPSATSVFSDGLVGMHETGVDSVAISDDQTKIFSKDYDGKLIMWTINQTEIAD